MTANSRYFGKKVKKKKKKRKVLLRGKSQNFFKKAEYFE